MNTSHYNAEETSWMEVALDEARLARDSGEVPVGAVVVLDGKIIGAGHNTTENRDDPSGHAEINALRAAGTAFGDWRLEQSTLIVTLEQVEAVLDATRGRHVERVRRVQPGS